MNHRKLAKDILTAITEAPIDYPAGRPSMFEVKYQSITPNGSRTFFTRSIGLSQIQMAQSETAVQYYLKRLHPGCDVIIFDLKFR